MDEYREQILKLLDQRGPNKTICPSEVLSDSEKQQPELMERVRASARRLAAEGKIEITQGGEVVEPESLHGPIRLRKELSCRPALLESSRSRDLPQRCTLLFQAVTLSSGDDS